MRSNSRPDLNSRHQRNDSGSIEYSARQRTDATSGAGGDWGMMVGEEKRDKGEYACIPLPSTMSV
jgi:hypothetical protein